MPAIVDLNLPPIIMIEDSPEDFETLSLVLRQLGIRNRFVNCATVRDARDLVRDRGKYEAKPERPNLILLDLNLPDGDGRDFLPEIRNQPAFEATPVLVFSTSNNPADVNLCYQRGANCYMVKPVGLESLELLCKRFCDFWLKAAVLPTPRRSDEAYGAI